MAITYTITCDRCARTTGSGMTVKVDQVMLGHDGDLLNVSDLGHRGGYSICYPCGSDLVNFLKLAAR